MSENFIVEIISPDESILKSEATEVILPSYEGQMGILKDHIPLITFLRPGLIIIKINNEEKIISKSKKERVEKQIEESSNKDSNIFFNVEYTGLDLNGNRYLLKSNEAELDKTTPEIVLMKTVHATFYFKDNTTLFIEADEGDFNNRTLDMIFKKNVEADFLSPRASAQISG